jgi:tetratricopeptide (TPR) repeat protein
MATPEPEAVAANEENVSFFRRLLNRRVPQILGVYIAAGWGMIQFIDWIVNRYLLSPHLIDLTIVILLSLIPSSTVVAYYHGRPGKNRWKKREIIGIPLNVIVTIILVVSLFSGKDLGSVSQKVTLKDETGKTIERTIPKSKFRKKIALFFFDNKSGDAALDWLQFSVPYLLEFDLTQDLYLEVKSTYSQILETRDYYVYNKIKEAGFKDGLGLPLMLKKKVAGEIHMDYFLSGTISKQSGNMVLEATLYHTKDAGEAAGNTLKGTDIFKLVDDLAVRLKHDLDIPKGHIERANDLPVAEMFTNSIPAARSFILGQNAILFNKDWPKALKFYRESADKDPSFAVAYDSLALAYLLTNQAEKWKETYKTVLQHSYKLPERLQYYVKFGYYQTKQDPEKSIAILKMIVKLYPDDLNTYSLLALLYGLRGQRDEAIASYKRVLEIDPQQFNVLTKIGGQYEMKGEFDNALHYYEKYAGHLPQNPDALNFLGDFHRRRGNFRQAKDYYEKSLLLEPDNVNVLTTLARVEAELGRVDKAAEQCRNALQSCRTAQEKATVYRGLASFAQMKGQMKKALEYSVLRYKERKTFLSPLEAAMAELVTLDTYVQAGKEKEAFLKLDAFKAKIKPPFDKMVAIGYLIVYLGLENAAEVEKRLPEIKELLYPNQRGQYFILLNHSKGRINEIRGEYADAVKYYLEQLKFNPADVNIPYYIGRCYRQLKQYDKAEEYLRKPLKIHPFDPRFNYEMALVYLEQGNKEKALAFLKKAVEVWKDADADYKPAQQARIKLSQLLP